MLSLLEALLGEPVKQGPTSGLTGSQETIPIRGTILSASFFIPYIFLFLMFKTIPADQGTRVFTIKVVISVILIVRCPDHLQDQLQENELVWNLAKQQGPCS